MKYFIFLGETFFALHGKSFRNEDLRPETQKLCLDAFLGCDGYVFNVTRTHGQPEVRITDFQCFNNIFFIKKEFMDLSL